MSDIKDIYDQSAYYRTYIEPIVKELKLRCVSAKIPMFITFATANNEHGTSYESDVVLAATERHLTDNRIAKLLMALNDFDLVPPESIQRAAEELSEYLMHLADRDGQEEVPVTLTEDRIGEMSKVADGSLTPKLREGVTNQSIGADFYDDLDLGDESGTIIKQQ